MGGHSLAHTWFGVSCWMDKETLIVCLTQMTEYCRKLSWWVEPSAGCSWCILPQCRLLSRVQPFATPWTAAYQASPSFIIFRSLLKLMSIESVMPSNHLILCHPLLLSSIFPSIWVFSYELALCIRWAKYWSFSFSISLSKNIQDWFSQDGLVGSPCSPRDSQKSSPTPQFKVSVLQGSAFMVQLSYPYMTTGKGHYVR